MKRVLELVKWQSGGIGKVEKYAQQLSNHNNFEKVNSEAVNKLFNLRDIPLQTVEGEEYYVYYNQHPSSGFNTYLYVNDEGKIDYKIIEPKGGVLCAFYSEIIVFTLTDGFL